MDWYTDDSLHSKFKVRKFKCENILEPREYKKLLGGHIRTRRIQETFVMMKRPRVGDDPCFEPATRRSNINNIVVRLGRVLQATNQ